MKKIELTYEERKVLRAFKRYTRDTDLKRMTKTLIGWILYDYGDVKQSTIDSLVDKKMLRQFWLKTLQEYNYALTKKASKYLPTGFIHWKTTVQVQLHLECGECGFREVFITDNDGEDCKYDETRIPTQHINGWNTTGREICPSCERNEMRKQI